MLRASLVLVLVAGCSSSRQDAPAASATPSASEPPPAPDPPERPDPPAGVATPTVIRVINSAEAPLSLPTTFGSLAFAGASRHDGVMGRLFFDTDDIHCDCVCPDACAECERPRDTAVTVDPGSTHETAWNGRLRRGRLDSQCQERFDPAGDRYVIGVCDTEGEQCGSTTVELPTTEPIEVRVPGGRVDSCDDVSADLPSRAARISTAWMRAGGVPSDRLDACVPTDARCVPVERRQVARGAVAPGHCAHLVVPRGHELEVETVLALPPGVNGGVSFRVWLDPAATLVRRVRYEQ